jgi:crotonobetainyl-CoA:carnitine CoA-transferase CaiB-like acyl-CoA transferase
MTNDGEQVTQTFPGPLDDIKVLDFSRVLAGPFATRMLADMGADVVKVEPPEGDVSRALGRKINGISGYFNQQNAGKRDMCLDLSKPESRSLTLALVEQADVVVENFRPRVMDNFGLGWSELSKVRPDLVMLSISGFGQVGPERNRATYAAVIHGESGLLGRQAFLDNDRPTDFVLSLADSVAAMHGLASLLAALHSARRTGVGQHIDLAMINTMLATDDYAHLALDGWAPTNPGGKIFDAPGGPMIINGDEKWFWHLLSTVHRLEDPVPRGTELEVKVKARRKAVEQWVRDQPSREELIAKLDQANLAWGNVYSNDEVWEKQASIAGRRILTDVDDRGGGRRRTMQSPYWFSAARSEVRGPAPFLGEHNAAVCFDWLGMSDGAIQQLRDAGALVEAPR